MCSKFNLFESQLPFTSFRPTEALAFLQTGPPKSSTRPSAARWAHPASNTLILTIEGGLRAAIPRDRGILEEGRDGGLIEFEVEGEAVEVEDELEWGIEAEGERPRIT